MDKKPLIGVSILAVVLLVLGSLSSVGGNQTVISSNSNTGISKSNLDGIVINGTMGENGWYVSYVLVSFDFPVNHTYFKINDGSWQEWLGPPIIVTIDGLYNVSAYYVDIEGNQSPMYYASFKIDQTIPMLYILTMIRAGIFKWKLQANASDETSGINRVEFYFNDNFVNTSFTPGPYIAYWKGSMLLLRLKYLLLYHIPFSLFYFYAQPLCIVYDNAGNNVVSPIIN
jgi:hypothetical protein